MTEGVTSAADAAGAAGAASSGTLSSLSSRSGGATVRRVVRQNQRLVWQWKRQWEGRKEDRRAGQQERGHQGQGVALLVVVVVVLVVVPGGLLVLQSVPLESCVRWGEM